MVEPHNPMKLAFIFKNMSITIPANKDLAQWLDWMIINHPKELKFLHKASQEYVGHGGGSGYTYARWLARLTRDVGKEMEKYNNDK